MALVQIRGPLVLKKVSLMVLVVLRPTKMQEEASKNDTPSIKWSKKMKRRTMKKPLGQSKNQGPMQKKPAKYANRVNRNLANLRIRDKAKNNKNL